MARDRTPRLDDLDRLMTPPVPDDDDDWLDELAAADPVLGAWARELAAGPADPDREFELSMRIHSRMEPDDDRLRWTVEWLYGPPEASAEALARSMGWPIPSR